MQSPTKSILFVMLGLLLGFGAATLVFRPWAIHSHPPAPKSDAFSTTPQQALAIEQLACDVGLNYSIRLAGTVKNRGNRPVDDSLLMISGDFPPPYSVIFSGADVSLPRQLKPGQLASFEIRRQLPSRASDATTK